MNITNEFQIGPYLVSGANSMKDAMKYLNVLTEKSIKISPTGNSFLVNGYLLRSISLKPRGRKKVKNRFGQDRITIKFAQGNAA